MARLPTPGSDKDQWGQVLNDFLSVQHDGDGTLKPGSVSPSQLQDNSIPAGKLTSQVQASLVAADNAATQTALTALDSAVEKTADLGKPSHAVAQYDTYAAIRALNPSNNTSLHYYGAVGAEGMFRYDPNDTTTPDDGGRVLVAAGGKRMKRVWDGTTVRPEWWGAKPNDNTVNSSDAFVAAINALTPIGGKILLSRGIYYIDGDRIVLPDFVTIEVESGQHARFSSGTTTGNVKTSTRLMRRQSSDTGALVTLQGSGSGLIGLQIESLSASTGTGIVQQGMETVLRDVRVIACGGIAIDVQRGNNNRWNNIYIDNCGSDTLPAMKIWSKTGVGVTNETNTFDCDGLQIERSAETALEIAVGATSDQWWAEWVRIHRLHIESPQDNGGTLHTAPLIKIGNVRTVEFTMPFIYGGTGYLIEHDQQANRSFLNGGIHLIGGTLIGTDVGVGSTASLVHLKNGNGFVASGTRFGRYTAGAIEIDATYGAKVSALPSCDFDLETTVATLLDNRTAKSTQRIWGNARVEGHVSVAGTDVTFGAGVVIALTKVGSCNDSVGIFSFGTNGSPSAGIIADVTFNKPYASPPEVSFSPMTALTVGLGLWYSSTTTGFKIRCVNVPAASQAAGTYQFSYKVMGITA